MAVDVPGGILKQTDVRETTTQSAEASVAYNTDFARFDQILSIGSSTTDLHFSPDGLKFYVCNAGDDVLEYTMTVRWDLSTASLTHTLDVSAKETELYGLFFKSDGTKMYTAGDAGNSIDEYDLSVAWDLSTAIYLQEFAIGERGVRGLWMREDGKMVFISNSVSNRIDELFLSTAWDITTAVFGGPFAHTNLNGIAFSRDGVYGFIAGPSRSATITTSPWAKSPVVSYLSTNSNPFVPSLLKC